MSFPANAVDDMPVLIYFSLIVLGIIVSWRAWMIRRQLWSIRSALASQIVLWTVILENSYYGIGRYWPDLYPQITWFWPAVILFKVGYIIAFAMLIFTYARPKEHLEPDRKRRVTERADRDNEKIA